MDVWKLSDDTPCFVSDYLHNSGVMYRDLKVTVLALKTPYVTHLHQMGNKSGIVYVLFLAYSERTKF